MKPFIEIKEDNWNKDRMVLLKLNYDTNKSLDITMKATCHCISIHHMKINGWKIELNCLRNINRYLLFELFITTIPTYKNAVVIRDLFGSIDFPNEVLNSINYKDKIHLFYPIVKNKLKQLVNRKSFYLTTNITDNGIFSLLCEDSDKKPQNDKIYKEIYLYKI